MSSMRKREIRMPDKLWDAAGRAAHQLFPTDERGERAALVRDAIADAAGDWLFSPYVAEYVKNIFIMNRFGDSFYSTRASLRFNSNCPRLPSFVDQKIEKQLDYQRECGEGRQVQEQKAWLLSRWLFNYAALYEDTLDSEVLCDDSDLNGVTQKSIIFENIARQGATLTREIIAGLKEYTQWFDEESPIRGDRAAFPIDVPTRLLEVFAIVDNDLYDCVDGELLAPELKLEIRNRESVAFDDRRMAEYLELNGVTLTQTSTLIVKDRPGNSDELSEAEDVLAQFRSSLVSAAARRKIGSYQVASLEDLVKTPERFSFFRLRWLRPRTGLQVCVRWEKPVRTSIQRNLGRLL